MKFVWMAILAVAAFAPAAHAQDQGLWLAESQSADNITGQLEIKADRIGMAFLRIPIVRVRAITADEAVAAFDADRDASGGGALYRVRIPATTKMLNKNTLCGSEDTEWMMTWATKKTLHVAFFSGEQPPKLSFEALTNSAELCGNFTYGR